MCRMLGKVSSENSGILYEMEKCPHSLYWLSSNGRKSHDPDVRGLHDDGCGMAYIKDGIIYSMKRGKADFWDDSYSQFVAKAESKLFMAHNRFTSKGLISDQQGAHPFVATQDGKSYAFCHNGAVDSFMEEAKARKVSDSEIFFEKLLQGMKTHVVSHSLTALANQVQYSSMCALLMHDDRLYAWRIFNESDKEEYDHLSRYYTLYISIRSSHVLIASEPLDAENWMLIPNNHLLTITSFESSINIRSEALGIGE